MPRHCEAHDGVRAVERSALPSAPSILERLREAERQIDELRSRVAILENQLARFVHGVDVALGTALEPEVLGQVAEAPAGRG